MLGQGCIYFHSRTRTTWTQRLRAITLQAFPTRRMRRPAGSRSTSSAPGYTGIGRHLQQDTHTHTHPHRHTPQHRRNYSRGSIRSIRSGLWSRSRRRRRAREGEREREREREREKEGAHRARALCPHAPQKEREGSLEAIAQSLAHRGQGG